MWFHVDRIDTWHHSIAAFEPIIFVLSQTHSKQLILNEPRSKRIKR